MWVCLKRRKCCRQLSLPRPKRSGIWFLIHRDQINDVEYADSCDVWMEFFMHHPNSDPCTRDFVAIKLSQDMITKQHSRIRMSSYRWLDPIGSDGGSKEPRIPANYGWFLRVIAERKLIGWIDFVANVAVNVPIEETVAYMGALYANHITIADWMFEPARLDDALRRAWIFQELAFGAFDEIGILEYVRVVRALGIRACEGSIDALMELLAHARPLVDLLCRRGLQITLARQERHWLFAGDVSFSQVVTPDECHRYIAEMLLNRCDGIETSSPLSANSNCKLRCPHVGESFQRVLSAAQIACEPGVIAAMYVLDCFTVRDESVYSKLVETITSLLVEPVHARCVNPATFFTHYGKSIVTAYIECKVTFERDREDAITSVGRNILTKFGLSVDAQFFLRAAWDGLHRMQHALLEHTQNIIPGFIAHVDPLLPEGKRLLGIGSLKGALLTYDGRSAKSYATEKGNSATFPMRVKKELRLNRAGNNSWIDVKGTLYHLFVGDCRKHGTSDDYTYVLIARILGAPMNQPAFLHFSQHKRPLEKVAHEVTFS